MGPFRRVLARIERAGALPPGDRGARGRGPGQMRHDRRLYAEVSKLVYRMIQGFQNAAAVIAYASVGVLVRFNRHLHGIFWTAASTGRADSCT